ncbi:MAG: glycosyltransferase family 39 protein [Elainellaceae cyanobacterium]
MMRIAPPKTPDQPVLIDHRQAWLPISLILLVAIALYLYKIGSYPLGTDELYSVYDAKELTLLHYRPLYFLLLHGWINVSDYEGWLRGLAALFGLGTIALTYQLGCYLIGRPVGLVAALVITLSPIFIDYSQAVRMYSLGNFLSLAGTLALTYALHRPSTKTIAGWAIARLLMILTIPLSVTLFLADGLVIYVRFRHRRSIIVQFGRWLLGVSAAWLPFAIALVSMKSYYESSWGNDIQPPSLMHLVRQLKFHTFWHFRVASNPIVAELHRILTALLGVLIGIALVKKHRSPSLRWLAAWMLLPAITLAAIASVSSLTLLTRYLMFLSPYMILLIAAGFKHVWDLQRGIAVAIACTYLIATSSGVYHYYTHLDNGVDWRGANQVIQMNEQPNDAIAVAIPHGRVAPFISHYYDGTAPIYEIPLPRGADTASLNQFVDALPPSSSRIWLLFRKPSRFQIESLQTALTQIFHVQSSQFKGGIHVFLLES